MARFDGQMYEALEAVKGLATLDAPGALDVAIRTRGEARALVEHLGEPGFRLAMVGESDSLGDASGQDLLSLLAGTGTAEVHPLVDEARSLGSFDGWCLVVPAGQLGNPLEQAFVRSIPAPLLPALALFITRHTSLDASQRAMFREYAQLIFGPMGLKAEQIAFFPSDEALDVLVGQQDQWEELRAPARRRALEALVRTARADLEQARTDLRERLWSLSSTPSPATAALAEEALDNAGLTLAPASTSGMESPAEVAPPEQSAPCGADVQAVTEVLASLLRTEGEALVEDLVWECVERNIHPLLASAPAPEEAQEALEEAIEELNAWLGQALGQRLEEHFELLLALCARQPAASALNPDIWRVLSEQRPWEPQGERLCFVAPAPAWATQDWGEVGDGPEQPADSEKPEEAEETKEAEDCGESENLRGATGTVTAPGDVGDVGDGGGMAPEFAARELVRHTPDWIWGARVAGPVAGALVGSWLGPRLHVRSGTGLVLGALAGAVGMELVLRASQLTLGGPSLVPWLANAHGPDNAQPTPVDPLGLAKPEMCTGDTDVAVTAAPHGAAVPKTCGEDGAGVGETGEQAPAPEAAGPAREASFDWESYAQEVTRWLSEEAGSWVREEVHAALARTEEALRTAAIGHALAPMTPDPGQAHAGAPSATPAGDLPQERPQELPQRAPEPSSESHRIAAGLAYIARAMDYVEALEEVLAGGMGPHFA